MKWASSISSSYVVQSPSSVIAGIGSGVASVRRDACGSGPILQAEPARRGGRCRRGTRVRSCLRAGGRDRVPGVALDAGCLSLEHQSAGTRRDRGMKWPYGSVAISGTLSTSVSVSAMPSRCAACALTVAPVGHAVASRRCRRSGGRWAPVGPSGTERRTRAGRPDATGARCRSGSGRRTVWSGSSPLAVDVRRPGEDHERRRARRAADEAGRRLSSGMNTRAAPPLVTRSRPWSKNWPKSVNHELYGADRPTSVATFGMKNEPLTTSAPVRPRRGRRVRRASGRRSGC